MGELASKKQLRMSFARWALVTVPLLVLLGLAFGTISNATYDNAWFTALQRPSLALPNRTWPIIWPVQLVLLGVALAIILDARGAIGRVLAIAAFSLTLGLTFGWSLFFFNAHQVTSSLWLTFKR